MGNSGPSVNYEPKQQERLIDNLADSMKTVSREIQLRQVRHFSKADTRYGEGVARALGINLGDIPETVDVDAASTSASG